MSYVAWTIGAVVALVSIWLFLRWANSAKDDAFNGSRLGIGRPQRAKVDVYTKADESRQFEKVKPFFRRETVEAKVKLLFPNHPPADILQLLDNDVLLFAEVERAQLDILKLSDGDINKLR